MCPHTGFAIIRAAAVQASTNPIRLSSSPWKSRRYSARNGKNAAIANPVVTNSPRTATSSRARGRNIDPA
jgi:hypothetical protein